MSGPEFAQSPGLRLERGFCDPAAILREVFETLRGIARDRSLSFRMDVPVQAPRICCDHDLIVQALCNMVRIPLDGHADLESVHLSMTVDDQVLQYIVSWRARRRQADAENLFDSFRMMRKEPQAAHGFAEAITARIVAAHYGELWVEREATNDCTVRLVLPLSAPSTRFAAQPRRAAHPSDLRTHA